MDRRDKEDLVATLHRTFDETAIVVVTHYSGLTVAEMGDLRRRMRDAGASFKVTKNRLTRLALQGTRFAGLERLFVGPTAIAYSPDPVSAAKVAVDYAKTNQKLIVVGGGLGEQVLDPDGVKALATMPSLDELRAKLIGVFNAPASKLVGTLPAPAQKMVGVLDAPARNMVGVLQAYAQSKQAA